MEHYKNKSIDTISGEYWRKLDDEDFLVSNLGRIKSISRNKIIGQSFGHKGYLKVNKVKYSSLVNRIVCHVFQSLSEFYGSQANHLNGIKTDNRNQNLEWATCQENIHHAFKLGLRSAVGSKNNFSKFTEDEVREIRKNYKGNRKQYAIQLGIKEGTLKSILSKKNWKHI